MASEGGRWLAERLGLYTARDVVDQQLLRTLASGVDTWTSEASTITRRESADPLLDEAVRSSRRVHPPGELMTALFGAIKLQLPQIASHFAIEIDQLEELQLLHYREGGQFVKHRDQPIATDGSSSNVRRISLVAFLTEPAMYEGGEFVVFPDSLDTHGRGLGLRLGAGHLLAFPADLEHQVAPVLHGTRLSAVTWAA